MKKQNISLVIILLALSAFTYTIWRTQNTKPTVRLNDAKLAREQTSTATSPTAERTAKESDLVKNDEPVNTTVTKDEAYPPTKLLLVPFTPQAPTANWDELHNEGCEEASAIMAAAYFSGDTRSTLPPQVVEQSITELTNWQLQHFGYSLDTTVEETAEMIREVYHRKATVVQNMSEEDIKQTIAKNKLVIIPVNGRLIDNPHYKQPGPLYHMLLVRGYTPTRLVTNDSGTKFGQNYSYAFTTLQSAMVDWDHASGTIKPARSVVIVQ
ncbi:MAG: C39 family peptidase [Patescibacteria group bacterium]|jgi:hypothetical protein